MKLRVHVRCSLALAFSLLLSFSSLVFGTHDAYVSQPSGFELDVSTSAGGNGEDTPVIRSSSTWNVLNKIGAVGCNAVCMNWLGVGNVVSSLGTFISLATLGAGWDTIHRDVHSLNATSLDLERNTTSIQTFIDHVADGSDIKSIPDYAVSTGLTTLNMLFTVLTAGWHRLSHIGTSAMSSIGLRTKRVASGLVVGQFVSALVVGIIASVQRHSTIPKIEHAVRQLPEDIQDDWEELARRGTAFEAMGWINFALTLPFAFILARRIHALPVVR